MSKKGHTKSILPRSGYHAGGGSESLSVSKNGLGRDPLYDALVVDYREVLSLMGITLGNYAVLPVSALLSGSEFFCPGIGAVPFTSDGNDTASLEEVLSRSVGLEGPCSVLSGAPDGSRVLVYGPDHGIYSMSPMAQVIVNGSLTT